MMNFSKTLLSLTLLCLAFHPAYSSVRVTAEYLRVHTLATDTKVYEDITGTPLQSWQDLARVFDDLKLSRIETTLPSGEKFTDVYSIVPHAEGVKFPDGVLMFIRYKPVDWPDIWSDGPKNHDPRARPIRYLVSKNSRGDITSHWWYEEKVQAMLAKTGLTIPLPTPYTAPSSSSVQTASIPPSSRLASTESQIEQPVKPVESVATVHPPVPSTDSSTLWWVIGSILLCGGAGFLLRKRISRLPRKG